MARGNLVSLPFQIVMHQEHVRHLYSHQLQIESHSNHLVSVTKREVKHEIIINKIVSGTGVFNTYEKLIPSELSKKYNFAKRLNLIKPSVSHGCLFFGLNGSAEA
mgnify:CR=1 FL=1